MKMSTKEDINVVFAINEPAAVGAYEALKAVGKDDIVLIAKFNEHFR